MNRFNVSIGNEFEVDNFEVQTIAEVKELSEIAERRSTHKFKLKLSSWLLVAIGVALIGATAIGLYDGTLDEVSSVWSAAALPLGLILKNYFDKPAPT